MTSLADFLHARIAEREAAARRAASLLPDDGEWCDSWSIDVPPSLAAAGVPLELVVLISLHGPTYVLAECEAKRRIVEEHYYMPGHDSRDFGFKDGNCVTCRKQGPCATLRFLALPYADHPDYREEWKP